MKTSKIREMSDAEIVSMLADLRREIAQLLTETTRRAAN